MAKVERSSYPVKKFMVKSPKGETIYFGQAGYGDYDLWSRVDPEYAEKKRYRYTTSHKAILLKDGTPAWKSQRPLSTMPCAGPGMNPVETLCSSRWLP